MIVLWALNLILNHNSIWIIGIRFWCLVARILTFIFIKDSYVLNSLLQIILLHLRHVICQFILNSFRIMNRSLGTICLHVFVYLENLILTIWFWIGNQVIIHICQLKWTINLHRLLCIHQIPLVMLQILIIIGIIELWLILRSAFKRLNLWTTEQPFTRLKLFNITIQMLSNIICKINLILKQKTILLIILLCHFV